MLLLEYKRFKKTLNSMSVAKKTERERGGEEREIKSQKGDKTTKKEKKI